MVGIFAILELSRIHSHGVSQGKNAEQHRYYWLKFFPPRSHQAVPDTEEGEGVSEPQPFFPEGFVINPTFFENSRK